MGAHRFHPRPRRLLKSSILHLGGEPARQGCLPKGGDAGRSVVLPERTTRVGDDPGRTAGHDAPAESTIGPDDAIRERLAGAELGLEETLIAVLRGIGAVMFLTTHRVIVARDGFERRPRSGFSSYPLESIRHVRLELGSAPSGRIAVWTEGNQEAVSMFFDARSLDRAHELIDLARPHIARLRRRGPGARPVRPPSGPADPGTSDPT